MDAYIVEWLNILARWAHFVTGIAWIGSSFYFIWLDNHLEAPKDKDDDTRGVGGELWSVHGGGFYHSQKYLVAPKVLPETLHWFKWEAYTTWISGMFLLALVYWYGAEVYLIDRTVADLSPAAAVGFAVGILAGGWFVYDLMCRSALGRNDGIFAVVLFSMTAVLAWGLCQLYSGRGAYIHFGAVLGTIMVANVFFVIIPGQRRMVDAFARNEDPDPADGIRAKQRSVHNTYFTLPVLFVMTSNHYALTYGHEYNWLILMGITLAGALIRVYFVARHKGRTSPLPAIIAMLIIIAVAAAIAPKSRAATVQSVSMETVRSVIDSRCTMCHSSTPTHDAFPAAPGGVMFDTEDQVLAEATRIHQQTVVLKVMPIGNLTEMNDQERALIDSWYLSRND
ncbi:MAG: urate hydroxylase PuuD [Proteobacteria bacterium]|nr:urate hydroxylase PuuD [Pseudomonadota bacterium]MDA0993340.1 urate hydroxylase PuuD [Pseudomonadota bacterium]